MKLSVDGHAFAVSVAADSVVVDGRRFDVRLERRPGWVTAYVNDRPVHVVIERQEGPEASVRADARLYVARQEGPSRPAPVAPRPPAPAAPAKGSLPPGGIAAHMTGRVLRIAVSEGQEVREGDLLLVIEAMKMENEIRARTGGAVKQVAVAAGARVQQGELLLVIE